MIIAHEKDTAGHHLESPEVKNVTMKVLVSPEQGWQDHVMRLDPPVSPGTYAFVPSGCRHQFRNAGDDTFRFICIVPKEGHQI